MEEAKKEDAQIVSINVDINQETVTLGRTLAGKLYADENKLGTVMEVAINFYLDHLEKVSGQQDTNLGARLVDLTTISCYETTLMGFVLKEMYCRDEKTKARYDELRSIVNQKVTEHFGKTNASELYLLKEKLRQNELEMEKLSQSYQELQQKHEKASADLKSAYNRVVSALKAFIKLTDWYEVREAEVPKIEEKNKGLFKQISYSEALAKFEQQNPKPQVPPIKFT